MPHQGCDSIVVAAQIVTALQTISSRRTDPNDALAVSVTQFHSGNTWNVIPEEVIIRGTARCFREEVQTQIENDLRSIAEGIAASQGAEASLCYRRRYPVMVNSHPESELAAEVAAEVVGKPNVEADFERIMGSEDFAFYLDHIPGCFVRFGARHPDWEPVPLHSPAFDIDERALGVGLRFLDRVARVAHANMDELDHAV